MSDNQDLTPAQMALADAMSELSEEHWCAGWLHGLEFTLWDEAHGGPQFGPFCPTEPDDLANVLRLSEACGGWIVWKDEPGETFVPMDEWLRMFGVWKDADSKPAFCFEQSGISG